MTMRECYEAIGGNYEAVLGRLHSEALIRRFALKFLEDQSYLQLKQALKNKNYITYSYWLHFPEGWQWLFCGACQPCRGVFRSVHCHAGGHRRLSPAVILWGFPWLLPCRHISFVQEKYNCR